MVFYSEDETTDENPESQEMLEEQLVRMLTREVVDLISKWRVGTMGRRQDFSGKRASHLPNMFAGTLRS